MRSTSERSVVGAPHLHHFAARARAVGAEETAGVRYTQRPWAPEAVGDVVGRVVGGSRDPGGLAAVGESAGSEGWQRCGSSRPRRPAGVGLPLLQRRRPRRPLQRGGHDEVQQERSTWARATASTRTARDQLFTIVADTMRGRHDTIGGCCSAASNRCFRYERAGHAELPRELPPRAGPARPGREGRRRQHQLLHERARAGRTAPWASSTAGRSPATTSSSAPRSRVLAVVSNCPQTRNPCNGFNPTPIRLICRRSGLTAFVPRGS